MHFFFPSFFNKLSSEEFVYLKNNESWVLEIFRDFWDLLMKKFEDSGDRPSLKSKDLDCVKHSCCALLGIHNLSLPQILFRLVEIPTRHLGTDKLTSKGLGMSLGGCSSSLPPSEVTEVPKVPIGGVCLDSDCPVFTSDGDRCPKVCLLNDSLNLISKVAETLSPMLLSISNLSTKPPPSTDRSNVTIRKKARPHNPKKPLGATEGGLAHFRALSPVVLDPDCSLEPVLPDSLNPIPDRVPLPTLRAKPADY
jgi:hypothetical protein